MDLTNLPNPYPLPYGEYLGEVEAVHLILAHDLYNELREIVRAVQELGSARDGGQGCLSQFQRAMIIQTTSELQRFTHNIALDTRLCELTSAFRGCRGITQPRASI